MSYQEDRSAWFAGQGLWSHIPEADWIYLVDAYGKHEKEDLSAGERKELKRLAELLRGEAMRSIANEPGESS